MTGATPADSASESAPEIVALPEGVTMADVLAALAAQSSSAGTARAPLSQAQVVHTVSIPFTPDAHLTATNTNKQRILCAFCDCVVLLPGAAQYEHKSVQLHPLFTPPPSQSHTQSPSPSSQPLPLVEYCHLWRVSSQLSFENVGVTRPVDGGTQCKYLCCANCERGPIGITFLSEHTVFYVAHGTVKYS